MQSQTDTRDLTMRAGTFEDIPAIIDMLNDWARTYNGRDEFSEDDMRNEWQSPNFDPADGIRIVENPDGLMVGYVEYFNNTSPYVYQWTWARTRAGCEGQGIGSLMVQWAEEQGRAEIDKAPADAKVSIAAATPNGIEVAHKLFQDHGLVEIRRHYRMIIDLDGKPADPVVPAGYTLRRMRGDEEIRRVYRVVYESFRDHWSYLERPFEEALEGYRHHLTSGEDYDPSLWWIAEHDATGEFAGVAVCPAFMGAETDLGWISSLGVLRDHRKQGLGRALLLSAFNAFYQRGNARVGLGVDAQNLTGALHLYEDAGMHIDREFVLYEKTLRDGIEYGVEELGDE